MSRLLALLALFLFLASCAHLVDDRKCAAGRRYTSGPHAGQCWLP